MATHTMQTSGHYFSKKDKGKRIQIGSSMWDILKIKKVPNNTSLVVKPIRNDMKGWGG